MATAPDTTPDDVTAPGPVTERTDGRVLTDDDIPGGLNGPFFQEIGKRKADGRDAKCLVTAKDGQTGVGKSNACDFLAYVTDTTDEGFSTEKATIEPMRFLELYGILKPGSAVVMEEGEQFDSRRAMTNENVEATHKWQKARVREIVAFVNLPDPTMIDGRFERLCDYWINVERRGFARIYKKRIHPTKRVIYYETMQTLEWPNMDGSATFRHMDSIKASLLDGELNNDSLIRESEADERVRKAKKQAAQAKRDELLTAVYNETDMTAGDVAGLSPVDVKGSRIRQIASDTS